MAAEVGLTTVLEKAVAIDHVEQFGKSVKSFTDLIGAYRPTAMPVGSTVKTYTSKTTLAGGKVPKGEIIPLSEVQVVPGASYELEYDKRRKAVPAEDIQKYGFASAVERTDSALLKELYKNIRTTLVANLATGTGTATGEGVQATLAQSWGKIQVAFEDDAVKTVAFINPLDVADYLAKAEISTQTMFGMRYLENFLGTDVTLLSAQVPKGTLYMTAANNLNIAYADVRGELQKAFNFTADESGFIGILHDIQHERLTAETVTLSGIILYAERLDGVVVGAITAQAGA